MKGRLFSIKKTTILRSSFILLFLLYIVIFILSLTIVKIPNLWFFAFCFFVGLQLMIKSFLFKLDSSCYFGVTLFLVGIFYFHSIYFNIVNFYSVFIELSFSISSFVVYVIFKQPFQFFISLSLFFVAIITLIFILNLISLWIFLAFILVIVLLLVCSYFMIK